MPESPWTLGAASFQHNIKRLTNGIPILGR